MSFFCPRPAPSASTPGTRLSGRPSGWLLSLLAAASVTVGCAQAAIDADAGLYDMTEPGDDAAAEAAVSDDAGVQDELDAAVPLDSGAGSDAAVIAVRDGAVDASTPEAGSDAGSRCVPGTYKGKFQGNISVKLIGIELLDLAITGDVTIQVATNSTGDKLVLNNGKIVGKDQDDNPLEATVSGTLDCTTGNLEGGKLENGKYTRPITPTVQFTGTATAKYTPDPPAATGTWKTSGGIESGSGTWNAALVP
jgi:hypothetical protein